MNLSEFCIKRPVFTIVFSVLLIVIGLIYFHRLPIRHIPNIDKPTITVTTNFEGASPDLVEKDITIPIENSLASISGVDSIRSVSFLGKSRINIDLQLGVDINETINDIRNKMSALQNKLPLGSQAPTVTKNDADATPIMIIGFHDSEKNSLEITDYLERNIKPALQEIQGVGEVVFHGNRNYAVKIALDPIKMAARHITVAQIKKALIQQNIDVPSGQIKSKNRYYTVVTHARLKNAQKFAELVIAQRKHQLIRLSDVAKIKVGSQNDDNLLRINSKPAVGLAILTQSNANPLEVAQALKKSLKQLQLSFPPTLKADIVFDATRFIHQSISKVYHTFFEAAIFVGLVVILFLGNLRAALIPIITIPICLISAFWPMSWLGFELNTLTLLAMVLAIGLVVDDAIVVLENCYRHLKAGLTPFAAAIKGSTEIGFAIIAMTITLAAVYAPIGFVKGFTGKLFFQFGATLAICVILSGIIALTLSPMMCSQLLRHEENRYSQWLNELFTKLSEKYISSLKKIINKPPYLLAGILLGSLLGLLSYYSLPAELAPIEDQSYIIGPVASPTNASTQYTNHYTHELEAIYGAIPEKTVYLASIKPSTAFTLLQLQPWDKRSRSQKEITEELNEKMQQITGVNVFPVSPNPFGHRGGNNNSQFSVTLLSNTSYLRLNEISNDIIKSLTELPELRQIKNNLALDSEQIDIEINRQLAADLEVNFADIAELLSTMLGGNNPANFNYEGQTYQVILQLKHAALRDVAIINKLYVQSERGKMIPLSSLVNIKTTIGPDSLPHLNRLRAATISAELKPNAHLQNVIKETQKILQNKLPDDVQYRFTGQVKDYLESSSDSLYAFSLALLFIYLVLAAQFESFIDPLIVLFSVPLCLIGALIALYLTHQSLSIYSNIGMITLIGLITKHGIMITEFANQQIKQGTDKLTALLDSACVRLRPILMTTLAMLLGALPLALATGAGSESRRQLGIVIIGGMLFGTLFSLYVVPYTYFKLSRRILKTNQPPIKATKVIKAIKSKQTALSE
ncbi:hydrophobic/amphiphilic exporter-1 (mainly G-bacteria), HAE1 family [Legionella beliardensis]|uniref:Hydrophobic/amphiphilic exporter-1 (Mainly G-bacteria), HAE1 family n=1 Tax=Legionella beliardensis TaxID=91822 RepID=A0A378I3U5_9GAMM|nr:efflux RND transporter permease subunit [Legionella beliardensis]STX29663.1 hydrophobic/amphiphilic exporter-1 (mainly G-bacteria), HAE1 family [Legionella beliardensis]